MRRPTLAAIALCLAAAAHAAAYDLVVQSAAVDQPRINFALADADAPLTPFVGDDIFGGETIYAQAFYDTGASGVVLAESIADALGVDRQAVGGQPVVFGDAAPGGVVPFNVSEPLVLRLADNLGAGDSGLFGDGDRVAALSDPASFTTLYDEAFGPIRAQIGPLGGGGPFTGDLNVVGVPAMQGKTVVMDARPTDNFFTLLDDDPNNDTFDVQMRTYVYDTPRAASPSSPVPYGNDDFGPGVPRTELSVSLTKADFARFTTLDPAGAVPPTLNDNPFIGPDPLGGPAGAGVPPVTMRHNGLSSDGSFLLDTGAAASFISTDLAAQVGVGYDPAAPLGSANPRLTGVPIDRQFALQISGISGEVLVVPGFFADGMLVRTDQGDALDDADPNHLNYLGAPVLVFDIEVFDPVANQSVVLDGIFGMNNLVATANIIPDDLFPLFLDPTPAPFETIVYDDVTAKLGLNFEAGGFPPRLPPPLAGPAGPIPQVPGVGPGAFLTGGSLAAAHFGGVGPRGVVLRAIPEPSALGVAAAGLLLGRRRRVGSRRGAL